MEQEFIKKTEHSVTLNVTGGKVDSYREIEKTTGTVRVYENGCIGVAGCLGEPDEAALAEQAREALAFGIPYPCKLEGPLFLEDLHEEEILPAPAFLPAVQAFLDRLGEQCPKFAFSDKISLNYRKTEYRNSAGRHLVSSGRNFSINLIAQNRGAGNLFDTGLFWSGTKFDPDRLLAQFKREYDAFYKPVELEPGRYPVVAEPSYLFASFLQHFIGDLYAAGASLVSGKLGQKLFSDKLTLQDDMNNETSPGACFFDDEGCVAPAFRPTLVEQGVLKGLGTNKKTAAQYGLPNSGTAEAAYDGVPSPGFHRFYVEPTAKTLKELVPGKAIFVVVASGGDTTPQGRFATPAQMAYLLEDGELVGRLPEINISGNFFDMMGKDYLGAVRDEPQEGLTFCAVTMDVTRG